MNPEYTNTVTISKPFREWTREELNYFLNITETDPFSFLEDWLQLAKKQEISDVESKFLEKLRKKACDLIDFWNEAELRAKFIAKLTDLVDFDNKENGFAGFAERYLAAKIDAPPIYTKLYGYVDWLVASGYQKPKSPFFFLHEYKPVEGKSTDGKGQLLAEMVAAQKQLEIPPLPSHANPKPFHFYKDIPIYGAYVKGEKWVFMALKGTEYATSKTYLATELEDLYHIIRILKAQKQIIYDLIALKNTPHES